MFLCKCGDRKEKVEIVSSNSDYNTYIFWGHCKMKSSSRFNTWLSAFPFIFLLHGFKKGLDDENNCI
jgi:hypothetical protein